jgi:hypothetical protein
MARIRHKVVASLLLAAPLAAASPVARQVKQPAGWVELLRNGALETTAEGTLTGWAPYGQGFTAPAAAGRGRSGAAMCDAGEAPRKFGLSQTLVLDRADTRPLLVSGWSRAESVPGSPDPGYSLYVDIIYQDGTPLWGNSAAFSCGTHDWEFRQIRIYPARPVKTVTLYALFRDRRGKAWFDDLSIKEPPADARNALFEGVWVEPPTGQPAGPAFQVRDVAADSHFFLVPAEPGRATIDALQLEVSVARVPRQASCTEYTLTVRDLAGRDRALTLYYVVPLDAAGWQWFDSVRETRTVGGGDDYHHTTFMGVGATARTSIYPFACVAGPGRARSLLVPSPRVCHLGYHAGTRELYAAFDIGLAAETRPPGTASVTICDAETDPRWGMRDTARLYYELLPRYFDPARVPRRQGNWMPFQAISAVQDPGDFGFAVHEGDNDVRWDNDHGVLPFVYIEPMTFWMPMPKGMPRTREAAMEHLRTLQADPRSDRRDLARATETSCVFDADGRFHMDILDTPWCDGAVFGNSADPDIPEPPGTTNQFHHNMRVVESAFKRAETHGGLAGVYLDSLEGWGRLPNYRRGHFAAAGLPLTFDSETRRPLLLNGFATQEWTEYIADYLHARGRLLMANSVPYVFPFLALPVDLLGTETNWQKEGRFSPPDPDFFYAKRVLSWRKPYMFLMNTRFETWTAGMTEQYMQVCLFYGMFPGFFSENAATNCYFQNPAWYNRDRPLFRRYVPIIRTIAQAGWEPITAARAEPAEVWVERWGTGGETGLFYTLLNTSDRPVRAVVQVEQGHSARQAIRLLAGGPAARPPRIEVDLPARGVEAIEVR